MFVVAVFVCACVGILGLAAYLDYRNNHEFERQLFCLTFHTVTREIPPECADLFVKKL